MNNPSRPASLARPLALPLLLGLAVSLTGCLGGPALNKSFNDYSAVYADISNRQLLLNLARAANIHPPRILQLGLINTTFTFASQISGNVGQTTTDGPRLEVGGSQTGPVGLLSKSLTWGATAGVSHSEQPTFSFTPLAGPQFAQGFLATVPSAVFFSMLEQGEPIDQLLRVLAQSVEYTDPATGKKIILVNDPNPNHPEPYVNFLRVAGICLELQQRQMLNVETATTPILSPVPAYDAPSLDQAIKLAEKGLTLMPIPDQPGKYGIATIVSSTTLHVSPDAVTLWEDLLSRPYFQLPHMVNRPATLPGARPTPTPEPAAASAAGLSIKLRSFFEIVAWISTEQAAFERLAVRPGFLDSLPPTQRQPAIRLLWDGIDESKLETPVAALTYGGKVYAITDWKGSRWNREVFTLLSYVESQISLDPKSLPVQQLINVR
jgi:hypothetical protein